MYSTILIPTDGSQCATRAVEHGLDLASNQDATVHVLYVVDSSRGPESSWDVVVERMEAEGENALDEAAELAESAGVPVERHLTRGTPSEEICEKATDYDVDLVVMGTCGHSGLKRLLQPGSTTERVIRECRCPVTVVPPNMEPASQG